MSHMLSKTKLVMIGIAASLLLAGTAVAAGMENSEDATLDGKNWRGRHFAPFTQEGDLVTGKYVEFTVDGGSLVNYTAKRNGTQRVIFTSVSIGGYDADAYESKVKGALYKAGEKGEYRLAAFDARNAGLFIHANQTTTVTYVVADGITLEYHAGEEGWSPEGVLLSDGDHTARLVARGSATVSVDGQTITVTLERAGSAAFHLDGKPRELAAEHWVLHKMGEGEKGERGRAAEMRGEHAPRGERPERAERAPREA